MSESIRLSDELIAAAKRQAKRFHRSPPQQVEHWAAIGRVMEQALSYPALERVADWGTATDIAELRATVESAAGREQAKRIIRKTAGTLAGTGGHKAPSRQQAPS